MNDNERILTMINRITQMGQTGINCVMNSAVQPALRQALKCQKQEYQLISAKAKNLARGKGLQIEDTPAMVQKMSGIGARMRLLRGDTDSKIAGMMIQGNTRGMIQSLELMHRVKDPDPEVAQLSQKLLETSASNIKQMEGFL